MRRFFAIAFLLISFQTSSRAASSDTVTWSLRVLPQGFEVVARVENDFELDFDSVTFSSASGVVSPIDSPTPRRSDFGEKKLPHGTHTWRFVGSITSGFEVSYQACRLPSADSPALCLPPVTVELTSNSTPEKSREIPTANLPELWRNFQVDEVREGEMSQTEFLRFLNSDLNSFKAIPTRDIAILTLLVLAILGGVALNLTPCVLPLLPITLAVLGVAGANRRHGLLTGCAYALGMTLSYGCLGLLIMFGFARFGELQSSACFHFTIAAIFLVLALASAGVLPLDLSRLFRVTPNRIRGGALLVALICGALTAVLGGACVAPVALAVLLFAGERFQSGETAALLLPFALGFGMGLPWIFAGAGLSFLPRPGKFMLAVKWIFTLIIAVMATFYVISGVKIVRYRADGEFAALNIAMARSQAQQRPLIVVFSADWCAVCKKMERSVFSAPEVRQALKNVEFYRFRAENLRDQRLAKLFCELRISGLPAFVRLRPKPRADATP